jgi:serine/threonine-protein kinase HipA
MTQQATVYVNNIEAGFLLPLGNNSFSFNYKKNYQGDAISLTMPVRLEKYVFEKFPPFFEGLLPEGLMLEALLRKYKIDRNDLFKQLLIVGEDVIGHVSVKKTL